MSAVCDLIQEFAHNELDAGPRQRFADHLPGCQRCQAGLLELIQLDLALQEAGAGAPRPETAPRRALPRFRLRPAHGIALAASLAAALVIGIATRPAEVVQLAAAGTRSLDARLSYPGAARYRPYDAPRAAASRPTEQVPIAALAELEDRKDAHGLGAGYLLQRQWDVAERHLAQAPASPDVESDRAALALESGDLARALEILDAILAKDPRHPQALWNRALALESLHLPLGAAEMFDAVGRLGESGWAEEANRRAKGLREGERARRGAWREADRLALEMIDGGAPLTRDLAARHPGLARRHFYEAVRAAASRQRAEALLPLAEALDALSGRSGLAAYVRQVAGSDFSRRAPLAEAYRRLARGERLGPREARDLLAQLRAAGTTDLEMGALIFTGLVQPELEQYRALATGTGDPWFEAIAGHERGKALAQGGDLLAAEAVLREALRQGREAGMQYRTARLGLELSQLSVRMYRLEEARDHARAALELAQAEGEWPLEQTLLLQLADVHRLADAAPLARAYLREGALREPESCADQSYVHELLAAIALRKLEAGAAAAEMDQVRCPRRSVARAFILADLARLQGTPERYEALRAELAALRQDPSVGPAGRALLDHIEGRALLPRDPAAGRERLRAAIEAAQKLPRWDATASQARTQSYVLLAMDSGTGRDALAHLATALRVSSPPDRCALAIGVDDERLLVVAAGPAGEVHGQLVPRRGFQLVPEQVVPATLVERLQGCERVEVLAQPPLQGSPRLLPPDLAWSYRLSGQRTSAAPAGPERRVVIHGTTPPVAGLPPLRGWVPGSDRPELELSGAEATPARVLPRLADATVIEFHVHGMPSFGQADAASLLLSPDGSGRYALRAGEIRSGRLGGAPLVLLAACHAAASMTAEHEAWSLPAAFLEAGARAVVASTAIVQDAEASRFFDGIRHRIRSGESPAVALREERLTWIGRDPRSWTRDVMLFE